MSLTYLQGEMAQSQVSHDSGPQGLMRRPSRSAATTMSIEVFDHEVVPASLGTIAPILRVAAEIEHERPRVAYLCMIPFFSLLFLLFFFI